MGILKKEFCVQLYYPPVPAAVFQYVLYIFKMIPIYHLSVLDHLDIWVRPVGEAEID